MELLAVIERHLRRTGMMATQFGRGAVNDPRLVHDLRNGRVAGEKVVARVHAYIAMREGEAA